MRINKRAFLILIYLCTAFSLLLFFMSLLAQILGYWIGGGDQMLDYLNHNLIKVIKISSLGIPVGFVLWFFYYRNIR